VGCNRACGHLQNESSYYVKYQGCNFCPGSLVVGVCEAHLSWRSPGGKQTPRHNS
jgi:hypothetical protein